MPLSNEQIGVYEPWGTGETDLRCRQTYACCADEKKRGILFMGQTRSYTTQGAAKRAFGQRTNGGRDYGTEQGKIQEKTYIGREFLLEDGQEARLVGTLYSQLVKSHPERIFLHAVPADKERCKNPNAKQSSANNHQGDRMTKANEDQITRPTCSSNAYVRSRCLRVL